MWVYYSYDELYHHGILGMKWGKRNGPPYPLAPEDHSASEKKAGWQKSIGLSDTQKKALAVAALATIGGVALYKSGALDGLINIGRRYYNYTSAKLSNSILSESDHNIFNRIKNAEFKGNGDSSKDAQAFLSSFENYAKEKLFDMPSIEKLSASEVKSIIDYTGESYKDINNYLRGFKPIVTKKIKTDVKNITEALDKMVIPQDTVVHRGASQARIWDMLGINLKSTNNPSDLIGREFVDEGFFSSSVSPFSAFKGASIKGKSKALPRTQIHTYIPKGAKGAYISPFSLKPSELEVLLQRGSRFKVMDAKFDDGKIIDKGLTDLYVLLIDQI